MPVTSLILTVEHGKESDLLADLKTRKNLEILESAAGQIALLSETASREEDKEVWNFLENHQYTLALSMIYHNFEDLEETNE
jgi:nitrate reductase NapAB chaperone NapD